MVSTGPASRESLPKTARPNPCAHVPVSRSFSCLGDSRSNHPPFRDILRCPFVSHPTHATQEMHLITPVYFGEDRETKTPESSRYERKQTYRTPSLHCEQQESQPRSQSSAIYRSAIRESITETVRPALRFHIPARRSSLCFRVNHPNLLPFRMN